MKGIIYGLLFTALLATIGYTAWQGYYGLALFDALVSVAIVCLVGKFEVSDSEEWG